MSFNGGAYKTRLRGENCGGLFYALSPSEGRHENMETLGLGRDVRTKLADLSHREINQIVKNRPDNDPQRRGECLCSCLKLSRVSFLNVSYLHFRCDTEPFLVLIRWMRPV